jgi:hypothetical protein
MQALAVRMIRELGRIYGTLGTPPITDSPCKQFHEIEEKCPSEMLNFVGICWHLWTSVETGDAHFAFVLLPSGVFGVFCHLIHTMQSLS